MALLSKIIIFLAIIIVKFAIFQQHLSFIMVATSPITLTEQEVVTAANDDVVEKNVTDISKNCFLYIDTDAKEQFVYTGNIKSTTIDDQNCSQCKHYQYQ